MNAEEFEKITGNPPENDDLERSNCEQAGQDGHKYCGLCDKCGHPKFNCFCNL